MTRLTSEHPLKTAVLVILASLALAAGASARHRKTSDAEPGTFDYYLLSLSWSPAICLDRDLQPRACSEDAARGACRAATLIVPPVR